MKGRALLQDCTLSLNIEHKNLGPEAKVLHSREGSADRVLEPVVRQKFAKIRDRNLSARLFRPLRVPSRWEECVCRRSCRGRERRFRKCHRLRRAPRLHQARPLAQADHQSPNACNPTTIKLLIDGTWTHLSICAASDAFRFCEQSFSAG